jgi:hypothetical protein
VVEENGSVSSQAPASGSSTSHKPDASASATKSSRRSAYRRLVKWALLRTFRRMVVFALPILFLMVIYNEAARQGGSARLPNRSAGYAVLLTAFVISLVRELARFGQIIVAANAPGKQLHVEQVRGGRRIRRVRASMVCGGMDLEWRVLPGKTGIPEMVWVYGRVERGRWLVIVLPDGTFIWPSSRTQPVIGTGMQQVLRSDAGESPVISAHQRLLAAYAQLLAEIDRLPFMVRRQPGQQPASRWWRLGAPRPVLRALVTVHIRRRLQVLGNALARAGALNGVVHYNTTRSALFAASEECKALAATLPRSAWRTITAFLVATALPVGLTIYTTFVQTAPIHIKFAIPQGPALLLEDLIFLLALVLPPAAALMFTRSLRCKRIMLCPASDFRSPPEILTATNERWDVYEFEREAFLNAGLTSPPEWEMRAWVQVMVAEAYVLTVFMPLIFNGGAIGIAETVTGTLLVSVVIVVALAIDDARNRSEFIRPRHHASRSSP